MQSPGPQKGLKGILRQGLLNPRHIVLLRKAVKTQDGVVRGASGGTISPSIFHMSGRGKRKASKSDRYDILQRV